MNLMNIPNYSSYDKISEVYQTNKISRATSAFPNNREAIDRNNYLIEKQFDNKNNMMKTMSSPLDLILIEGYNLDNNSVQSSLLDLNKFK